jgi:hypothetical protein
LPASFPIFSLSVWRSLREGNIPLKEYIPFVHVVFHCCALATHQESPVGARSIKASAAFASASTIPSSVRAGASAVLFPVAHGGDGEVDFAAAMVSQLQNGAMRQIPM